MWSAGVIFSGAEDGVKGDGFGAAAGGFAVRPFGVFACGFGAFTGCGGAAASAETSA